MPDVALFRTVGGRAGAVGGEQVTDVRRINLNSGPIVAKVRVEEDGAANVLAVYRTSGWHGRPAQKRKAVGLGAGTV